MLPAPRILIGISGSIAAYKTAELVRALQTDFAADVQIVLTQGAATFVSPLTLQALTGRPVRLDLFDPVAEAAMDHIQLARWADMLLIAPASAHCIAQLAAGLAGDLLTTLALATTAPCLIAPAMNQQMWQHRATQQNLTRLTALNYTLIPPDSGVQACGEVGPGRLAELPRLLSAIKTTLFGLKPASYEGLAQPPAPEVPKTTSAHLKTTDYPHATPEDRQQAAMTYPQHPHAVADKQAKKIRLLITAGPTCEDIDPVRYLSNRSSGKMGYALAQAAAQMGYSVTLLSGPVHLPVPEYLTAFAHCRSANALWQAVQHHVRNTDIFISAAAVADYTLKRPLPEKLKKSSDTLTLTLERTPDILANVAALPEPPFTVGFAAETQDVLQHAQTKLAAKQVDIIIANDVANPDIGFDADDNQVTLLSQAGQLVTFDRQPKLSLAYALIDTIMSLYQTSKQAVQ